MKNTKIESILNGKNPELMFCSQDRYKKRIFSHHSWYTLQPWDMALCENIYELQYTFICLFTFYCI